MSKPTAYTLPAGITLTDADSFPHHGKILAAGQSYDDVDVNAKAQLRVENGPTIESVTPVHLACLVSNVDFLKNEKVVSSDSLTTRAAEGRTCAEFCARGSQVEALAVIAQRGAPVNEANSSQVPPAYLAAQMASVPFLRALREKHNVDFATVKNSKNMTLLHAAVVSLQPIAQRLETINYLLSLNVIDVTAKAEIVDDRGDRAGDATAFALACSLAEPGSVALVQALFQCNAHKANLQDATGGTKQAITKLQQQQPITSVKIEEADKKNTVVFARRKGFPVMPMMIEPPSGSAAEKPVMPQEERPAAATAAAAPAAASAEAGAQKDGAAAAAASSTTSTATNTAYIVKLDTKRDRVNSPLHVACQALNLDTVKFLIERAGFDADKNALCGGVTPFYLAIRYAGGVGEDHQSAQLDVAKYLLDSARVDIDKPTADGATPLYCAAFFNLVGPLKFLIERNASTTVQFKGASCLFGAVAGDALDAARILIEQKVDVLSTYKGLTLAGYARSEGKDRLVQLFAEHNIS